MVARPLWLILKMTLKLGSQLKEGKLVSLSKFGRSGMPGFAFRFGQNRQERILSYSLLRLFILSDFPQPHLPCNLPLHLISMKHF